MPCHICDIDPPLGHALPGCVTTPVCAASQVLSQSGQQETPAGYCTFRTVLLSLVSAFSFAILVAIIFILLREGQPPLTHKDVVCEYRECHKHASLVGRGLNRSLDPCQDFSAFVCSGWRPMVDYSYSVEMDARIRWITSLVAQLSEGRASGLKMMSKPEALYRMCTLRARTDTAKAVQELATFMRELGLPWPDRPPVPADPMDLMVKLSFAWDLPSWIQLSLDPLRHRPQRVLVRPAAHVYGAERHGQLARLSDPKRFRDYWAAFYQTFVAGRAKIDEERVERFRRMENYVAQAFRKLLAAETQNPALTTLSAMTNESAVDWTSALNRHMQPPRRFTDGDEVLMSDRRLRSTLSDLLTRYRDDIQEHLGWAFVQKYGGVANESLHAVRYQANQLLSRYAATFACMRDTEDVFGLLLAAHWRLIIYSPRERRRLDNLLRKAREHAMRELRDAPWPMASGTRHETVQRLRALSVRIWPSDRFHSEQALSRVFRRFPSTAFSYVEMWVACRRELSALLVGDEEVRRELRRLPPAGAGPLLRYDPLSNSVSAAAAALGAPFYYAYGISAMWYGGLVSVFTRELVRAMSPKSAVAGLRTRPSRRAANNTDCEPGDAPWEVPNFELPALELTFDMWQYQGGNAYLKDINYTAAQIFFITVCHVMCKKDYQGRKIAPGCNDAVRNFEPFAKTFQCEANAPMNPAHKCSFFPIRNQTPFSQ
ncbi:endothelin-converting enzyme 1-like [Amblyomma americanum]